MHKFTPSKSRSLSESEKLVSIPPAHWHHLSTDQAIASLNADVERGLEDSQVERLIEQYGGNLLPERTSQGPVIRFLLQFHQPLIYLLLVVGAITIVLQDWVDAMVILGVVVINAIIGFLQEAKAIKAIDALFKSLETSAKVIRSGVRLTVPAHALVPGDTVLLSSGDRVPADLRLIKVRDLQTDESALTGESLPVEKQAEELAVDTTLADRHNLAYCSTLVTYGTATGVVIATGKATEIGKISELIANSPDLKTPLTTKIESFSRVLLYVVIALAVFTFGVGILRGQPAVEMFKAAVALAVGAVPEGLPAAVTIILAIGVNRMARRNAIVRKLPAVETLGSTTVICSDKTGTLTQNKMTVREIYAGGLRYQVTGEGFSPIGQVLLDGQPVSFTDLLSPLARCLQAGVLCNDSRLVGKDGEFTLYGNPTEGALLAAAGKLHAALLEAAEQWDRIDTIPFESRQKYMAALHQLDDQLILMVKGAPEQVIELCKWQADEGGASRPLDNDAIRHETEKLSALGLRVLAFAAYPDFPRHETLTHAGLVDNLTFLGLQALIDPPRKEAAQAIAVCQKAGIAVKMITGDHLLTARTIASQLGIEGEKDDQGKLRAVSGHELQEASDEQLAELAQHASVFARVSPEQKLRLVCALQAQGHIVAMTGDGVNDAPALKQANIGVAMGITGTEVSKDAAHIVLTDDNFSTIEAAVEEGRGVFDNLTKVIVWTLPTNLGEGLVILVAILLGASLPILPLQILWINMTTAVLLGLMLAFEPKEPNIMLRPPRDTSTPILTSVLIERIVLVGFLLLSGAFGLFEWCRATGLSDAAARTVAVNVFVFAEMLYLFNCRSLTRSVLQLGLFTNPWIWLGVVSTIFAQLAFTYLPFMNELFDSEPIGLREWIAISLVSAILFAIVGLEKKLRCMSDRRGV